MRIRKTMNALLSAKKPPAISEPPFMLAWLSWNNLCPGDGGGYWRTRAPGRSALVAGREWCYNDFQEGEDRWIIGSKRSRFTDMLVVFWLWAIGQRR